MKRFIIAAGVLLCASPALAHVVIAPATAEAGSYFVGAFRVGHGCSGAATTAVRVEIPAEIGSARPRPVPGWRHSVEMQDGRVAAITWKGRLPDEEFQAFEVLMKLPAQDQTLIFPTVQSCGKAQARWVETDPTSAYPAPRLEIVPASAPAHQH